MKNYTPALNSEGESKVQEYRDALTAAGLVISGLSPDGRGDDPIERKRDPPGSLFLLHAEGPAMRRFPPESRAGILCQSKMRFI